MTSVLPLRVMVEDVWNEVYLEMPEGTPVGEVKRQALERTHVKRDPSEYVLKFRGAELSGVGQRARLVGQLRPAAK